MFLLYSKSLNNREKITKDWWIYSSSQQTLQCLPLFSSVKILLTWSKHSDFLQWKFQGRSCADYRLMKTVYTSSHFLWSALSSWKSWWQYKTDMEFEEKPTCSTTREVNKVYQIG
jgi:hypothetical protein